MGYLFDARCARPYDDKSHDENGGVELIDGAAPWIQQEQPAQLGALLLDFVKEDGGKVS